MKVSEIEYNETTKEFSFIVYSMDKINIKMVHNMLDV